MNEEINLAAPNQQKRGFILRPTPPNGIADSKPETPFTIVSVSSNRNSFGLHSLLCLNAEGEGWHFLQSTPCGKAGDSLPFHPSEAYKHSGECAQQLPSVDAKTAGKLLKSIKRHVALK